MDVAQQEWFVGSLLKKVPTSYLSGSPEVWNQNWLLIQNRVDSVSVGWIFLANRNHVLHFKL